MTPKPIAPQEIDILIHLIREIATTFNLLITTPCLNPAEKTARLDVLMMSLQFLLAKYPDEIIQIIQVGRALYEIED